MNRVYAIKSETRGIKIGMSYDPALRARTVTSGEKESVSVAFMSDPLPCAAAVEEVAHRLLKDSRTEGEWFDVTADRAEAAILQAAEEVARDGTTLKDRPRWRENKTRVTITLNPRSAEYLGRRTETLGIGLSEYIRRLIDDDMDRENHAHGTP